MHTVLMCANVLVAVLTVWHGWVSRRRYTRR